MSFVLTFDKLTDGQKHAFDVVMSRIAKKQHTTIRGPAGTGKTAMMKFIVQELVRRGEKGVMLATPTHQAKKVLSKAVGKQAYTLHSLLRLNPTNYEDTQVFEQKETPKLDDVRIIIVDEASMVDKKLFDILMRCAHSKIVIIAVGDPYQLRPVDTTNMSTEKSPFFSDERFEQVELTEIKRSDGEIIEVATKIRNGGWIYPNNDGERGVFHNQNLVEFLTAYFNTVKEPKDLLENRIVAFTNKSVEKLNEIVRKRIYKTDEPVIVGEILVAQEPLLEDSVDPDTGKKMKTVIFNNGEFLEVKKVTQRTFTVKCDECPTLELQGYALKVESKDSQEEKEFLNRRVGLDAVGVMTDDPEDVDINILTSEDEKAKLAVYLSGVAGKYRDMKRENPACKPNWKSFWALKNTFLNVKALPACTIHKSQGISVDNVFLYTACLCSDQVDAELASQLLYVGATRARHNVYYI